ncbi:MAG TPA: hypothetical protein VHU19_01915 [Pyrinomonadaceae bacterium]|jgi:hypothetical protein|nr:hypothetical protein [Pyrinomonadaceae bacterium]
MKHRSIIAFILLAAALVAAPQVSHDLAALKNKLGARIRGEILHAFLNVRASEDAIEVTPPRAAPQLASCEVAPRSDEQTPWRAKPSVSRAHAAPQAEASTQKDAPTQLAMLVDPLLESVESGAELPGVDDQFIRGNRAELPRRAAPAGELAMLIPPGSGIDIPATADERKSVEQKADAANEQRKSAELRRRLISTAANFETLPASKVERGEALKYLGPLLRDTVWVRAAENGTKVRVFTIRRPAKAVCANPPASTPPHAPADALVEPRPAPPVSFQTSAGE